MSTESPENTRRAGNALMPVGGQVTAVVPQTFEEIQRIAAVVNASGVAPAALVGRGSKRLADKEAIAAITVALMAGAELGIPPMASLRSFTVIGGRPALFGDGLVNVVRRSGRVKYISEGYDPGTETGWCESQRSDTGEVRRVEFTKAEAIQAGLWDERKTVPKWDYDAKKNVDAPNESPWFRYRPRMMQMRARGFCLRDLYADVLSGVTDEWEAREIATIEGAYEDVRRPTPSSGPVSAPTVINQDTTATVDMGPGLDPAFVKEFLGKVEDALSRATTSEAAEEEFDALDVPAVLTGDEAALATAFDLKKAALDRFTDNG